MRSLGPGDGIDADMDGSIVAVIVQDMVGGQLVSAQTPGGTRWFNRIGSLDCEISLCCLEQDGDGVRIALAGALYPGAVVRDSAELPSGATARAKAVYERACGDWRKKVGRPGES